MTNHNRPTARHLVTTALVSLTAILASAPATASTSISSPAAVMDRPSSAVLAKTVGSGAPLALNQPITGAAITPSGNGYWLVASDGGIFSYGDAKFFGSTGSIHLNQPITGMAATPSGNGYWFVASDGGIFSYGDAKFFGSTGNVHLNQPITGMAATPSGNGYWLVASDGGIFAFGDARFFGSAGGIRLAQPIVGMAATPSGNGYWFVASDGGIFAFGDARFFGSAGGIRLARPISSMAATPSGNGYWLVADDGGIFGYGDGRYYGSAGGGCLGADVVAVAAHDGVQGYWIVAADGQVRAYADPNDTPGCTPAAAAASGAPAPSSGPSGAESAIARDMFARVNAERAARGLPALVWDDTLSVHARSWSQQMAKDGGFRHSDLTPLLDRFTAAAENIAYARGAGTTAGLVHDAWMESDGHRANILAPNLDVIGIGVVCAPDGTMWATQQYGRFPASNKPSGFGSTPPKYPIVRSDPGTVSC
ncbi:MAG: CAP domain-containing protein [Acidimicrobiia bacterium]